MCNGHEEITIVLNSPLELAIRRVYFVGKAKTYFITRRAMKYLNESIYVHVPSLSLFVSLSLTLSHTHIHTLWQRAHLILFITPLGSFAVGTTYFHRFIKCTFSRIM